MDSIRKKVIREVSGIAAFPTAGNKLKLLHTPVFDIQWDLENLAR